MDSEYFEKLRKLEDEQIRELEILDCEPGSVEQLQKIIDSQRDTIVLLEQEVKFWKNQTRYSMRFR